RPRPVRRRPAGAGAVPGHLRRRLAALGPVPLRPTRTLPLPDRRRGRAGVVARAGALARPGGRRVAPLGGRRRRGPGRGTLRRASAWRRCRWAATSSRRSPAPSPCRRPIWSSTSASVAEPPARRPDAGADRLLLLQRQRQHLVAGAQDAVALGDDQLVAGQP